MRPAGTYDNRVRFERRTKADDGHGNVQGAYAALVTVWAAFKPSYGREQIAAGRLESGLLGVMTVRRSSVTACLTADDRVIFTAGAFKGRTCNIRAVVPTTDSSEIELTVEAGVAT